MPPKLQLTKIHQNFSVQLCVLLCVPLCNLFSLVNLGVFMSWWQDNIFNYVI